MTVSNQTSVSFRAGTKVLEDAPVLDKAETAIVIVGSGTAGSSVAWKQAKAGQDAVVVDRGPTGKGMTSPMTAHLTDGSLDQLIGRRGSGKALV